MCDGSAYEEIPPCIDGSPRRLGSGIEEIYLPFAMIVLEEAGGELVALQQILGHSTIRMTQKYGRPGEKTVRAEAARVLAVWESPNREQNREHGEIPTVAESPRIC